MGKAKDKAGVTDTVAIEHTKGADASKIELEAEPQVFTYADFDEGVQKQWPVQSISPECGKVIHRLQKQQSDLDVMQMDANDLLAAIDANKQRIRKLLPSDDLAVVTALERREEATH